MLQAIRHRERFEGGDAPYTNLQPSLTLAHIRVKTDPSQTEAKHDKQIPRMNDSEGVLTLLN